LKKLQLLCTGNYLYKLKTIKYNIIQTYSMKKHIYDTININTK